MLIVYFINLSNQGGGTKNFNLLKLIYILQELSFHKSCKREQCQFVCCQREQSQEQYHTICAYDKNS